MDTPTNDTPALLAFDLCADIAVIHTPIYPAVPLCEYTDPQTTATNNRVERHWIEEIVPARGETGA